MFNPVTTSVTSMAIAPDARGGGMGDVGAATEADVNSQYWNPAKYPFCVSRAGVALSYTPWLRKLVSDINLAHVAGYYRIGDYNSISASLRYFSLGEVSLWDNEAGSAIEGMTIKPYELAVDAAYSRMLSDYFSMAVAMRFIYSDITYDYTAESSAGKAFAVDIALYYNNYFMLGNRECQWAFGLNISNIGGIVGENPGVTMSCLNSGSVGYHYDGYNVGGVAGKCEGFLQDCENTGAVTGRRDVGGICGQLVPFSQWDLSKGKLDELEGSLLTLQGKIKTSFDAMYRALEAAAQQEG